MNLFASGANNSVRVLVMVLMLVACGCAEPEFFPLPNLTVSETDEDYNGKPYTVIQDFVVIANPPKDRAQLKAIVDAWNVKTLISKQPSAQVVHIRRFYKETASTPRDFKGSDDVYFSLVSNTPDSHVKDMLLEVNWDGAYGKERSYGFYESGHLRAQLSEWPAE
jgi:hypothetical protein